MPIVVVRFPKERWRKVNVSRFLSRFKSISVSKIVDVPEDELDKVVEVLKRNDCEIRIVEPVKDDIEVKILKDLLKKVEAVRLGFAEPKDLERVAVNAIVNLSFENFSEDVANLLHDCVDFAENPTIMDLNEIERRTKEILKGKLN